MGRKQYTVEVRYPSEGKTVWSSTVSTQSVGLERARGIVTGIGLLYPCPDRRIVEEGTGRVVDEWPAHGAITVANNPSHK
jgi:hypothetical protein